MGHKHEGGIVMDAAAAYVDVRKRILGVVDDLSTEQLETPVPGCPAWTVKDLVGHLTGNVSDFLDGNVEGVGTDEWTARQVAARRDVPPGSVLDEWNSKHPAFMRAFSDIPPIYQLAFVADVVNHEADIRGALGMPRADAGKAMGIAREFYVTTLKQRLDERGLPAVRLRTDDEELTVGDGEPAATVSGDAYEILRALSGRRTPDQVRALKWEGDAEQYVAVFSHHPYTTSPISD